MVEIFRWLVISDGLQFQQNNFSDSWFIDEYYVCNKPICEHIISRTYRQLKTQKPPGILLQNIENRRNCRETAWDRNP